MPKHIETFQDWLEWDPMDESIFTIACSLLLYLIKGQWIDALDAYVLLDYTV